MSIAQNISKIAAAAAGLSLVAMSIAPADDDNFNNFNNNDISTGCSS
jgi:uncharacterized membrane protein YqiK